MWVGNSKVMKCSTYGNKRWNVCKTKLRTFRGNGLFLVPEIARVEDVKEGYNAWGALKSGLSN